MKMINGEEFYSISERIKIIKEALPFLCAIDNETELRVEIKKISEEVNIPEEAILIELKKYWEGPKDEDYPLIKLESEPGNVKAEKLLIRYMLGNKEMAQKILRKMRAGDFSVFLHRRIVRVIDRLLEDGEEINSNDLVDHLKSSEAIKLIINILMREEMTSDEKVISGYIDTVNNFRQLSRKDKS